VLSTNRPVETFESSIRVAPARRVRFSVFGRVPGLNVGYAGRFLFALRFRNTRCTPSRPSPSPAKIDSNGKPRIGGGVGGVAPVTVYILVVVTLVVV
jgi:hypothetical protein